MHTFLAPSFRNIDPNLVARFDWAANRDGKVRVEARDEQQAQERFMRLGTTHTRKLQGHRPGQPIEGAELERIQRLTNLELTTGEKVFAFTTSVDVEDAHGTIVHESALRKFAADAIALKPQFVDEHDDSAKLARVFFGEVTRNAQGKNELVLFVRVLPEIKVPGQPDFSLQKAIETGFIEHTSLGFTARGEMIDGIFIFKHDPSREEFKNTRLLHLAAVSSPSNPGTSRRSTQTTIEVRKCNCDKNTRGAALVALLEANISEENRQEDIGKMATAAGISESTVGQILREEIDCPPRNRIAGFGRALGISIARLNEALETDGCTVITDDERNMKTTRNITIAGKEYPVEAETKDDKLLMRGIDEVSAAYLAEVERLETVATELKERNAKILEPDVNDIVNLSKEAHEKNAHEIAYGEDEVTAWPVERIQSRAKTYRAAKAAKNEGTYVPVDGNGNTTKVKF